MLIGEFRHTIDIKKRLALPAKFRKELGETVIITRGLDNCLAVYPEKEWETVSDKLGKLPPGQAEARGYARIMLAGAMAVGLDKLGRILVPDYLKNYANLTKSVVVCGLYNRLEIWDAESWDVYRKKMEGEIGDMAGKLKELGI
ncbi:MAG: cell division/cell wall cluster transcriptional repressor MraZ [Candidatus Nealsonbacteria bacterium RIFCSPLOWO2_01_FULL_41_9]|uniref:Transcriptional regulator MraZ n=1 Tax=Candidatus Nealsonbacteria bacterium RIFCSPLOWO2_01_FULL_41_9 TaxID=1801671 RepID=A0A1G2EDB5_9BACT|nr:MAG: cell division/cell wall cluster transcriptional repressor MraZ [Candidatus Nealsonbacteria bacterium RIFCSPLOWO2_01_FULL_41_9]